MIRSVILLLLLSLNNCFHCQGFYAVSCHGWMTVCFISLDDAVLSHSVTICISLASLYFLCIVFRSEAEESLLSKPGMLLLLLTVHAWLLDKLTAKRLKWILLVLFYFVHSADLFTQRYLNLTYCGVLSVVSVSLLLLLQLLLFDKYKSRNITFLSY